MHPTIANGLIGPSCIDSLGIGQLAGGRGTKFNPSHARVMLRVWVPVASGLFVPWMPRIYRTRKGLRELLLVGVAANDENLLQRRACELYELRGREEGHDLDDWLQAESEFVQQKTKAAAAQGTACKFLCWVC